MLLKSHTIENVMPNQDFALDLLNELFMQWSTEVII